MHVNVIRIRHTTPTHTLYLAEMISTFPPPPLPADNTLRGKLLRELKMINESECVSYALRYYGECSENE